LSLELLISVQYKDNDNDNAAMHEQHNTRQNTADGEMILGRKYKQPLGTVSSVWNLYVGNPISVAMLCDRVAI